MQEKLRLTYQTRQLQQQIAMKLVKHLVVLEEENSTNKRSAASHRIQYRRVNWVLSDPCSQRITSIFRHIKRQQRYRPFRFCCVDSEHKDQCSQYSAALSSLLLAKENLTFLLLPKESEEIKARVVGKRLQWRTDPQTSPTASWVEIQLSVSVSAFTLRHYFPAAAACFCLASYDQTFPAQNNINYVLDLIPQGLRSADVQSAKKIILSKQKTVCFLKPCFTSVWIHSFKETMITSATPSPAVSRNTNWKQNPRMFASDSRSFLQIPEKTLPKSSTKVTRKETTEKATKNFSDATRKQLSNLRT